MRRVDSSSNGSMHTEGERERCMDDIKATTLKRKKIMYHVYGDYHKPKSNSDRCTNVDNGLVLG